MRGPEPDEVAGLRAAVRLFVATKAPGLPDLGLALPLHSLLTRQDVNAGGLGPRPQRGAGAEPRSLVLSYPNMSAATWSAMSSSEAPGASSWPRIPDPVSMGDHWQL